MAYSHLVLDIDAKGVAHVALHRPEVHNAFDEKLIAELTTLFDQLDKDTGVRLAVLSGNGKSFCAGGDLNWMRSMKAYSYDENIADSKKLAAMYARIQAFSKPLIGIVQGAALGGGSGLVAVCDYVVASEDAKFGFTETRLGIIPAVISPYAIEKIGISAARAYFTSGMQFSAAVAKDLGLVHRVVASEALNHARDEVIAEFLKAAPMASRKAKLLIRTLVSHPNDKQLAAELTVRSIADARISEEGQEGMDALLSKRKPKWVA